MTRSARLLALFTLLATGCSEGDDPRAAPCTRCGGSDGVPIGGGVDLDGGGGGTGGTDAGTAGAGSETISVTGDVALFQDVTFDFDATVRSGDPADVIGFAPGGDTVATRYDGLSFTVDDLSAEPFGWMGVRPLSTATENLPTLRAFDLRQSFAARLMLVQQSQLDTILNGFTVPVFRDPDLAQVIVFSFDPDGAPVAGINLRVAGAETAAYLDLGTWSDAITETTDEGGAFLVNVPALDFPGGEVTVTMSGAVSATARARVARGWVTLMELGVEP